MTHIVLNTLPNFMEENGVKRSRADAVSEAAYKKLKLGHDVLPKAEGGVNYIETDGKTCSHAVALPEGSEDASTLPPAPRPGPAAKEFPFTLDPFQRTAINCLEAGTLAFWSSNGPGGFMLRHFAEVQHRTY